MPNETNLEKDNSLKELESFKVDSNNDNYTISGISLGFNGSESPVTVSGTVGFSSSTPSLTVTDLETVIENLEVKSLPAQHKNFISDVVKEFNDEDNTIVHFITVESEDRFGDIVRSDGMDDSAYSKNPVVLFGHDSNSFPIGKSLWRKNTVQNGVKGILAKTKFAKTEDGQVAYELWRDGFLNASSIGFIPKKYSEIKKDASQNKMSGYDFQEWELLEYSVVPVPANDKALRLAYTKSFASNKIHKALEAQYNSALEEEIKELKEKMITKEALEEIKLEIKELKEQTSNRFLQLENKKEDIINSDTEITANLFTDDLAKSFVREAIRGAISNRE